MALGIAIVGFIATVAAAFGGAWYGARLQRSSDTQHLALQLQIDSAARFIGSAGECIAAYGVAWAPGTENLAMTERQAPIFNAFVAVRTGGAAVGIVGPDRLAELADRFLKCAGEKGLTTSFDVNVVTELGTLLQQFIDKARELRPPTDPQHAVLEEHRTDAAVPRSAG
ncbi:hypothetical protein GHK86_00715 [Acidimicrobiaceae bacterium USS-CC1]|uniref:Uncharacterized protein n=1 Tax=Acidiferrimicrobium australe TaxID=2664430 RepID=A0ABW9QS83_9ACTN|nr:hypothetical protein [Acidiferrimicrobium australe]